ncbi:MAG: hypothetical protein IT329_24115 [Caldilineaceae bacterium]|nr:hypothetical protein [Caldilineaceae bacterium]
MLSLRYLPQNLTVFFGSILGGLTHADWSGAWARGGLWGLVREGLAALTGFNAWPFFVDARGAWPPDEVAALLRANGIATWGWGYAGGEFYFRVKRRQAHWAQYLLLHNGVAVGGRLLDESLSTGRTAATNTAATSTAGAQPPRAPSAPSAAALRRSTPLRQLDRLIDHIADL